MTASSSRPTVSAALLSAIFLLSWLSAQLESPVEVEFALEPEIVRAGEVLTVRTTATMAEGWHIYAINEKIEGPIPSSVMIDGQGVVERVGTTSEPVPIKKFDEGFGKDTYYHEGTVTFETAVKIVSPLEAGEHVLNVGLQYQACNASICLPPRIKSFELPFTVEAGEPRPERTAWVSAVATDDDIIDLQTAISRGFGSFILLSITMGFLALLTPCVFPMIPITVSYFTKQGEVEGRNPIRQATVYSLGIIATYTILGLILAATLGAAGANQLAASPWVNLFIGALFVYFALSLFGMYEIQLPSALRQFSLHQERRGGYVGTLFMALTFTLTSFTCTVQFVGLLLVRAIQGDWLWPGIGMLFFSGAFALPFFFLALFPQYLSRLPQSGGWLNSVKVVMGFLELAAAFKFFSNTDLVWGWGFFTKSVVLTAWVVITFLTGLYLLGKVRLPHDSPMETVAVPRLVFSIFLLTFSIYMARGLTGQPLHGLIDAYLPPVLEGESRLIAVTHSPGRALRWIADYDEGVAEATRMGKPIFINFTGYTCTNCRWMEANVFTDARVVEKLSHFVLVELFTDVGPNQKQNQRLEIERFNTAALPFYVILTPDGEREIATFPGLTRDINKFLNFLNKGVSYTGTLTYDR